MLNFSVSPDSKQWEACARLTDLLRGGRVWIWANKANGVKFHGRLHLYAAHSLHDYTTTAEAVVRPAFEASLCVDRVGAVDFRHLQVRVLFDRVSTEVDHYTLDRTYYGVSGSGPGDPALFTEEHLDDEAGKRGLLFDEEECSWCYVDTLDDSYWTDLFPVLHAKYTQHGTATRDGCPGPADWADGCAMTVPLTKHGACEDDLLHTNRVAHADDAVQTLLADCALHAGHIGGGDDADIRPACVDAWVSPHPALLDRHDNHPRGCLRGGHAPPGARSARP